jgi:hypothetical protein
MIIHQLVVDRVQYLETWLKLDDRAGSGLAAANWKV